MNLHGVVRGAIPAVTPDTQVVISSSAGYTRTNTGEQVPLWTSTTAMAQIQPLSTKDLHQVDAINQGGELRAAYLYGVSHSVVRSLQKGGDLITFNESPDLGVYSEWLVTQVLEQWPDWVKVAMTRQNQTGA